VYYGMTDCVVVVVIYGGGGGSFWGDPILDLPATPDSESPTNETFRCGMHVNDMVS
jgi:hypothetical protein